MAISRARRLCAALLLALLPSLLLIACSVDDTDRCGPHMVYDALLRACVCEEGAVAIAGGCEPCAPDEIVVGGACACPEGQAHDAEGVCTGAGP